MMAEPKTILVVEDDEGIRFIVRKALESLGYLIKSAANGLEALELLRREGVPQMILLDMQMPVMDGWRFAAELKASQGKYIPIVVMTAAGDAEKRAADIHAEAWLGKPFSLKDLQATVKRIMS